MGCLYYVLFRKLLLIEKEKKLKKEKEKKVKNDYAPKQFSNEKAKFGGVY